MTHEEYLLGELLAVLNGDGGHYAREHGIDAAAKRGIERHTARQVEVERLREALAAVDHSYQTGSVLPASVLQTLAEHHARILATWPERGRP